MLEASKDKDEICSASCNEILCAADFLCGSTTTLKKQPTELTINKNHMKATEADTMLPHGRLHLHPPRDVTSSAQPKIVLVNPTVPPTHINPH